MTQDNSQTLPTHVGLILDGNRRWAKENGVAALEGHRQGLEVLKDVSLHAFENGVEYLSAFVFSTENWQRAEKEISYLMDLVIKAVDKYLEEFNERGIRIVMLGRRKGLRQKVLDSINRAEEKTKDNQQGTLALCFNYGGREELADAVKLIVAEGFTPSEINVDTVTSALYNPDIPDVDLLIRTSGEKRTSGFMLYRAAYAELKFIDKYWPDFTKNDFDNALSDYSVRERRYGA